MANLRQSLKSTAATVETLYSCTGAETISGILSANNSTDTYIWVYIVPQGWTADSTNMIIPWVKILATETKILANGITPLNGDTIQVKSTSGNVIFHLFGDIS